MRLYHYTCVEHLHEILDSRELRLTESNLSRCVPHAGPDVLWLTTDRNPWRGHGLGGSSADKSAIRFCLEIPSGFASRWLSWAESHDIDPRWMRDLINHGGGRTVAGTWWVTETPIDASRWELVENTRTREVLYP